MFKSVEYAGFDGRPELKAKAEQLTPVLADEIRSWRDQVEVTWRPAGPDPASGLELSLSLSLPNGSGGATGHVRARDLAPGEEGWLRSALRGVWMDALDVLIAQMSARREASALDPVEA